MNRPITFFSMGLAAALTACGHPGATAGAPTRIDPAVAAVDSAPAAVGSPAAPKIDGAILDACSLVTKADAESILGAPARLYESEKDDKFASHCSYEAVDQLHGVNMLGVEIHTDEDANDAKTGLAINRKMYSNASAGNIYDYQALSGIGDDAFIVANKTPKGMPAEMMQDQQLLFAVKGIKDIHMITSYSGAPRLADSLQALAKRLADHL